MNQIPICIALYFDLLTYFVTQVNVKNLVHMVLYKHQKNSWQMLYLFVEYFWSDNWEFFDLNTSP